MDITGNTVIAPSKLGPWSGAYDADERFSRPQLYYLTELGLDPETVATMNVRVGIQDILCPVIRRSHDRSRAQILTTGGDKMWVDA